MDLKRMVDQLNQLHALIYHDPQKALVVLDQIKQALISGRFPQRYMAGNGWSVSELGGTFLLTIYPRFSPLLCLWFPNIVSLIDISKDILRLKKGKNWIILEAIDDGKRLWKIEVSREPMIDMASKITSVLTTRNV